MMHTVAALVVVVLALAAPGPARAAQEWLAGSMTDAGPHPRLIFRGDDLPVLQGRLARQPYLDMLAAVQSRADAETALDDHSKNNEVLKAMIAKSSAFLYAVGRRFDAGAAAPFADEPARRAYAEKAGRYLLSMHTRSLAKGLDADGGLGTSEALHLWAQAFDLLKGAGFDFTVDVQPAEGAIVQAIADLAADLWADYMVSNAFTMRGYLNNHRSKAAAAIGTAAIALNGEALTASKADGRYDLAQWVDFAMRYLDLVLMSLETDQEATYQESGGYYAYTGVNHLPFFRAWSRYTGAASYTYEPWRPDVSPYLVVSAAEPYTVRDFWTNPFFHAQLDYIWRTMLPDRTAPPFDDCTPGVLFYWGYVVDAAFTNAGVYRWAWESSPHGLAYPGLVGAADLIAAFDDGIAPQAPQGSPDVVLPIAGNVAFRSSWEGDATMLFINAEHGNAGARTYTRWGDAFDALGGHEHLEPGSFMVYAGATPLVIDSGYLGWQNHGKVNNAYNHNLLLVDDKGPVPAAIVVPDSHTGPDGQFVLDDPTREGGWTLGPDGDAYLVDSYISEHMKIAVVKTRYDAAGGFEWTRRFVWMDDRYLAVYDEFLARDGKPHKVKMLLHGNGGGTSGGQYEEIEHGALWTQPDARVRAIVLSDLPVTLTTSSAIHDRWQWDERTHSVLNATVDMPAGEAGKFMTVLAVEKNDGTAFATTGFTVTSNGSGSSVLWADGNASYMVSAWRRAVPDLTVDLDFVALHILMSDSSQQVYGRGLRLLPLSEDGGEFITGGPELFIKMGAGTIKGYLLGDSNGKFVVGEAWTGGDGVCDIRKGNEGGNAVEKPGTGPFNLDSTGSGQRGVVAAAEIVPPLPFRPALDVLKPVALSGVKSCDSTGGTLSYAWRVAMKPELSQSVLSEPAAAETSFTPDLPGSYRVELEVSGSGAKDVVSILFHVEGDVREARAAMDAGADASDAGGDDAVTDAAIADAGVPLDAGLPPVDASAADAGSPSEAAGGGEGGCGCTTVGI